MNDKTRRLFHWLLTGAAAGLCAVFNLSCAVVLVLFSGVLFGAYEAALAQRRKTAKRLCDDIDLILDPALFQGDSHDRHSPELRSGTGQGRIPE